MLPEPLKTGNYELHEVAAPEGYVLSKEPVPFTVDGSEAVVTVVQHNKPQKATDHHFQKPVKSLQAFRKTTASICRFMK